MVKLLIGFLVFVGVATLAYHGMIHLNEKVRGWRKEDKEAD